MAIRARPNGSPVSESTPVENDWTKSATSFAIINAQASWSTGSIRL